MTKEIKELCNRINGHMKSYCLDNNELLYEKTMNELNNADFKFCFKRLDNLKLHRVRLNKEDNELFKETKNIYNATIENVCNYGRVNRPKQSMFYCAENHVICNLELLYDYLYEKKIGYERLATNSVWEIVKELNILILSFAPKEREFDNGLKLKDEYEEHLKSLSKFEQEKLSNFYFLSWHFFQQNAKENQSIYIVCSAISNYCSIIFPNIDGFIYPTVQGNTGYNIVLKPHALENKMVVPNKEVTVKKWIVEKKKSSILDPFYNKTGSINNENIIWDN